MATASTTWLATSVNGAATGINAKIDISHEVDPRPFALLLVALAGQTAARAQEGINFAWQRKVDVAANARSSSCVSNIGDLQKSIPTHEIKYSNCHTRVTDLAGVLRRLRAVSPEYIG